MKIFLQHGKSCLYFQGAGAWTRDIKRAFDFEHPLRVIEYIFSQRLSGMKVVFAFIDEDSVELLPIEIDSEQRDGESLLPAGSSLAPSVIG